MHVPAGHSFFPGQRDDEKVELFIAKHPIVYTQAIFLTMLWAAIFSAGMWVILAQPFFPIPRDWQLISGAILALATAGGLIHVFFEIIDHIMDIMVVTNERVINIIQSGIFRRNTIETELKDILNVEGSWDGFWPTILSYGTLEFHTASEKSNFTLHHVDKPAITARLVMDIKYKREIAEQVHVHTEAERALAEARSVASEAEGVARAAAGEVPEEIAPGPEMTRIGSSASGSSIRPEEVVVSSVEIPSVGPIPGAPASPAAAGELPDPIRI